MARLGSRLPRLVAYGTDGGALELAARSVSEAVGWEVIRVHWQGTDVELVDDSAAVDGYVLVGAGAPTLNQALARRAATTPLIALGGASPPAEATPDCWFRAAPPTAVLATVLTQLVAAQPAMARSWRRKSDMIIGHSAEIAELLRLLDRFAPASSPVLITGESGTGKELAAQALHYSSPRAKSPFIAVNCAAIPATLFESELFGYVRGAFTGAATAHAGLFEAADGGTLFLDEIGEMPLALQAKMLRVLESGDVTRVGATEPRHVDARIVTATNRDLELELQDGRFRQDLYYRIRVCHVRIPPLRQRPEDIAPLVMHHLTLIAERERRPPPGVTRAALERLLSYDWPGNVRELINMLERAFVLAQPGAVDAPHIVLPVDAHPVISNYREARDQFDEKYYAQLLRAAGGNISLAAKLSHRTRTQVYEALRRFNLVPADFRTDGSSR